MSDPDPSAANAPSTPPSDQPSASIGFVAPSVDDLNTRLPQFEFIDLLGVGGMGAVYKARQPKLNRFVAIKLLPRIENDEHGFRERFEREAQSMAQLSHPHIVPVYDFGETEDGQLYFVMEFVEGADLHQLIHGGQLTLEHFFSWIPQVCSALEYAHDRGIIHRDIKPANILINLEGQVRVADFGLAKLTTADRQRTSLTHKNLSMGTPDYAAPEQIDADHEVDGRVDIYALGVVMYQMLTGKVPRGAFRNPSERDDSIDPRLDGVILQAMQSRPADRFRRATEISTRLHEIQTSSSASETGRKPQLIIGSQASKTIARTAERDSDDAIPVAEFVPKSRAVPIAIVATLVLGLIVAIAIKFNATDPSEVGGKKSAGGTATVSDNSKKPGDKSRPGPAPNPKTKPEKDKDKPRPEKTALDGNDGGKVNGGTPDKTTPRFGGGGPDRRRRMFGSQGDHEHKSIANLTLTNRGQRPLEDSSLARVPEQLGEVARLSTGQAPGKQGDQTAFVVAQNLNGELFAWGDDRYGQDDIPDAVRAVGTDIIQLKAGSAHVLALDRHGKVYAWGRNQEGQCSVPVDLPAAKQIVVGPMFSAALLRDGRVITWGGKPQHATPADLAPASRIAAGQDNLIALHRDGTVTAWGADRAAVGNTPAADNVVGIACAQTQHFALLDDGQLMVWSSRPAIRPLPNITAREIHGAHDALAIRLKAGGWIFFGHDSRNKPMISLPPRPHLHAAVSTELVFSWSFDPRKAPLLAGADADSTPAEDVPAEPADAPVPAEAQSAIDEVELRFEELYLERVENPFAASVANLNEFYLKYLEADAVTAQANAQLDALLAIQAESERIGSGESVPDSDGPDTPAALVNRRAIYRDSMHQFSEDRATQIAALNQLYLTKLDTMQADFTRDGKTDEALAIRTYRERFAATRAAEAAMQDQDSGSE